MSTTARKNDTTKIDLSILPLPALEEMAKAFMFGEKKYGRYNYCSGFDSHRLVGAALRHLSAWQDGEDLDPEVGKDGQPSGASHLGHAMASIAMLLHTIRLGTNKDTRLGRVGPSTVANTAPDTEHASLRGPGITEAFHAWKTNPPLKLEAGKTYKTKGGDKIVLEPIFPSDNIAEKQWKWKARIPGISHYNFWTAEGRFWIDGTTCECDLVEEVSESAYNILDTLK